MREPVWRRRRERWLLDLSSASHGERVSRPRRDGGAACRLRRGVAVTTVLGIFAHGCAARTTSTGALERLDTATCRAYLTDERDPDSIRQAALRSLAYLARLPPETTRAWGEKQIAASDLRRAIDIALEVLQGNRADWTRSLCERLNLYALHDAPALLTGYYQPVLAARRRTTGSFRYPLYGVPRDLAAPYYTRQQIDAGALAGKAEVIAWLNDPVDAFFLQVQGSGILELEDGSRAHVGYAASNGRPYRSIGKLLIEQGKLEVGQASMQGIKAYLRRHPAEQAPVLQANERYIFFRVVPAGPIGSIGVILTDGRSIAADASVYPAGAMGVLATSADRTGSVPRSRIVLIQDAGAAIAGPGRFDLFVGTGAEAGAVAGRIKTQARFAVLLPAGVL